MKTLLSVVIIKYGVGTYTKKVTIDPNFPLKVELDATLRFLQSLYKTTGNIEEVILIEHNLDVLARWTGSKWIGKDGEIS